CPSANRVGIGEVFFDEGQIALRQLTEELGQPLAVFRTVRDDVHVATLLRCLRKSMIVGSVVLAAVLPTNRPTCPASSRSSCLSRDPMSPISGAADDSGMMWSRLASTCRNGKAISDN